MKRLSMLLEDTVTSEQQRCLDNIVKEAMVGDILMALAVAFKNRALEFYPNDKERSHAYNDIGTELSDFSVRNVSTINIADGVTKL